MQFRGVPVSRVFFYFFRFAKQYKNLTDIKLACYNSLKMLFSWNKMRHICFRWSSPWRCATRRSVRANRLDIRRSLALRRRKPSRSSTSVTSITSTRKYSSQIRREMIHWHKVHFHFTVFSWKVSCLLFRHFVNSFVYQIPVCKSLMVHKGLSIGLQFLTLFGASIYFFMVRRQFLKDLRFCFPQFFLRF